MTYFRYVFVLLALFSFWACSDDDPVEINEDTATKIYNDIKGTYEGKVRVGNEMMPVTIVVANDEFTVKRLPLQPILQRIFTDQHAMEEALKSAGEITTFTAPVTSLRVDTNSSMLIMEPTDLVFSKGQQETFTSPELREYINRQIDRGSSNVVQYEVEYHKRIATSFASFILTTIGVSLSSRKRKGGMGLYLGIGLALSFSYILLQTVSATFAINAGTPAILAAWIPNIVFAVIAYFCYRQAPN